jgi:hypothetical protein
MGLVLKDLPVRGGSLEFETGNKRIKLGGCVVVLCL